MEAGAGGHESMFIEDQRLLVVSNRLPVVVYRDKESWKIKPSSGGLVTAMAPIMRQNRGVWIGWPGCTPDAPAKSLLANHSASQNYDLIPVSMTDSEIKRYYRGFANGSIWPLFHDLLDHFKFNIENWNMYSDINQRFAQAVEESATKKNFVWIHDYQLMLVARFLREMGFKQHLSFFLHIPFPSLDMFRRLPFKEELLKAMLDFDHIGFQTPDDRRNFVHCLKWLVPDMRRISEKRQTTVHYDHRDIILGHYPISIDFDEFDSGARKPEVTEISNDLRGNLSQRVIVLGLDRLDYTKGIRERFLAFERMLEKYPETLGKISLVQIVVPSRLDVPDYRTLKDQLDAMAGRINGRFAKQGWIPIHYQFRELDRANLLGHYRASDIALITPLRDGMNLVAKEYCAANIDESGVLLLSEFAGAAHSLGKGAILVNPFDVEGTADALYSAFVMPQEERQKRMRLLRSEIKRQDVRRWVKWFIETSQNNSDEKLANALSSSSTI